MATARRPLKCLECGEKVITRTGIGHGDYQEFAFPCPGCKVEIRFGMNLFPKEGRWEYTKIKNAKWIESERGVSIEIKLDARSLVPVKDTDIVMPFLKAVFLANNVGQFADDQSIRFHAIYEIWPIIEKLIHHYRSNNNTLFKKQLKSLGYEGNPKNRKGMTSFLLQVLDHYGTFFRIRRNNDEKVIRQRVNLAYSISKDETKKLIDYLGYTGKDTTIFQEIEQIRKMWANKIYTILFPIFVIFYWDDNKHNLDSYTLCQKRFENFKQFYVDCFETFCRISLIASSLEGIIFNKSHKIPRKRGEMELKDYDMMNNGAKPDILKNLSVLKNIFVPYMDNKLRNGVGHHAARYNVNKDCIEYQNQSESGVQHFEISYIRFCEKIVQLYIQIEIASLYVNWAYGISNGIRARII